MPERGIPGGRATFDREMEVFDAVRTLLAVREYADRPVPEDVVNKIVEAGHLTASSINKQPWHFVVVQQRGSLQRLGQLVKSGPYTASAALAVVVAIPDHLDVLAVVPFGYPARSIGRGKKQRKPLGDVFSRERYGQPFA